MDKNPNETIIDIALPLPLGVAGTLMKLIGTAYPEARTANTYSGMRFIINNDAEPEEIPSDFEAQRGTKGGPVLTQLDDDGGITVGTPGDLASICLSIMKKSFAENPDAKNYLEATCFDREDNKRYAMTFQRAEGKTPHEARIEAETDRDYYKEKHAKSKAALHAVLRNQGNPKKNKPKTVRTAKELKALPQETIIKNPHVIAFKRGGDVWYISNVSPKNSKELSSYEGDWTIVELGTE